MLYYSLPAKSQSNIETQFCSCKFSCTDILWYFCVEHFYELIEAKYMHWIIPCRWKVDSPNQLSPLDAGCKDFLGEKLPMWSWNPFFTPDHVCSTHFILLHMVIWHQKSYTLYIHITFMGISLCCPNFS